MKSQRQPKTLAEGRREHARWSHVYTQGRQMYRAVAIFLMTTIGVTQDSVSRDVVLLLGVGLLVLWDVYRDRAVRQVVFGHMWLQQQKGENPPRGGARPSSAPSG